MTFKRNAFFWGALFLAIVGFVLHIRQLYSMSATLALLPLISWALSRWKLQGLEVERKPSTAITVGETARIEFQIDNRASARRILFSAADRLPENIESEETVDIPIAVIEPGQSFPVEYEFIPARRGVYTLGPVILHATDPLGLRYYRRNTEQISELIVYPRSLSTGNLWPQGGAGRPMLRPQRRRGEGDELYGVREYVPGDDPRRVDWKTTARRGKMAVVEYQQTESGQGCIILDLGKHRHAGEGDNASVEYAVTLAATLMEQAMERGTAVSLVAAGQLDHSVPLEAGDGQRLKILESLARAQPDGPAGLAEVVAQHQPYIPQRGAVVVLSPSPEESMAAQFLHSLDCRVRWFVLDANTFSPQGGSADYGPLGAALASLRMEMRVIRGDLPLQAIREGAMHAAF